MTVKVDLLDVFLEAKDVALDVGQYLAEAKYELIFGGAILIPVVLIFHEEKKWFVVILVFILMLLFKYNCGGFDAVGVLLFNFFHVDW